jgi:hypothetical protein
MSSRKPKKDWLKQLQKRKQKRFEGLKDKLDQGPFAGHGVVVEPAGQEKMSDVLEDFIEPYMGSVEDEDAHRKLLSLGVLAWNAALLPEDRRKAMIDDFVSKGFPPGSADLATKLRSLVDSMVERKLAHFASNRRAIISFELKDTGRDFHLTVASTLEDSPAS